MRVPLKAIRSEVMSSAEWPRHPRGKGAEPRAPAAEPNRKPPERGQVPRATPTRPPEGRFDPVFQGVFVHPPPPYPPSGWRMALSKNRTTRISGSRAPRRSAAPFGGIGFLHRFNSFLKPQFITISAFLTGSSSGSEVMRTPFPTSPETRPRFHGATALTPRLPGGLQHPIRKRGCRHSP